MSRGLRSRSRPSARLGGAASAATVFLAVAMIARGGTGERGGAAAGVPWAACPDVAIELAPAMAPLVWRGCGPGCSELVVDGGISPAQRLYGIAGASDGQRRLLGLGRDRGEIQELVIAELGDGADRLVFAATMQRGFHGCMARLRGVAPTRALVELSTTSGAGRRRVLAEVTGAEAPRLLADDDTARAPVEVAASGQRRAASADRRTLTVDDVPTWTAPAGMLITQIAVTDDAVYVATMARADGAAALWVWTPVAGATVLREGASAPAVGDGQLIWRERGGDGAVVLMAAPLVTTPGALAPRRLAVLGVGTLGAGEQVVGGGRVVVLERDGDARRLSVVDLATGVVQALAAPGGRRWSTPLWSDHDELAAVLDDTVDGYRFGDTASGQAYSVVRLRADAIPGALPAVDAIR